MKRRIARMSQPLIPCPLLVCLLFATLFLGGVHHTQAQNPADENCLPEFDKCVMNRDCCGEDIECVAGKWEVTTDSTCLSTRSKILEQLSRDEKLRLLKDFYDNQVPPAKRKSTDQVVKLYEKNARSFAKLVARLEKKYDLSMVEKLYNQHGEEL